MQEQGNKAGREILLRTIFLMVVFGFAIFIPIVFQLYKIQINEHETLEQKAMEQQTRSTRISASRGTIYDCNMKTLAISASADTVSISPKDIKSEDDAKLIAGELSRICGVDYDKILAMTEKKKSGNQIIRKRIEKEMADEVRAFINKYKTKQNNLTSAVYLSADTKRYYPYSSFASNVLGFVGEDNQGLQGIEVKYEDYLKGTPGQVISAKDAKGGTMSFQYEKFFDAQDGQNLVLTIDETIQHFVEKQLETAVVEYKVQKRACAIVMDVKTGGILSMATKDDYDLNEPFTIKDTATIESINAYEGEERAELLRAGLQDMWRNKPVVDTYEPGSTFKIITTAIGLEEKVVSPSEHFNCSGSIVVPGWGEPIRCHKRIGHGSQTFIQGVMNSCNPVFITVGQRIGGAKFYEYMEAFGFMEKTGIDLPGEAVGVIHTYEEFTKNQLTVSITAFGQRFNITPIQLITAVSAVANGGNLMKPHILKEMLDNEGNVTMSFQPEVLRQVISAETSAQIAPILEQVVKEGTGRNAGVPGYRIAGKTGTSQKPDPNTGLYTEGKYIVSFMAFAPVDDPQIALLVIMDEPMAGAPINRSGGGMAAPVAGRMLADILPYIGVVPQYTDKELANASVMVMTPTLTTMLTSEAKKTAETEGLKVRIVGNGERVTDQVPAPGANVPMSAEVILYTEGLKPAEEKRVPNIIGKTPEQANTAIVNAGLYMKSVGATGISSPSIVAKAQDYAPGTFAVAGTVVTVEFHDGDIRD